jgi:small-conductance mechanosensitive channel
MTQLGDRNRPMTAFTICVACLRLMRRGGSLAGPGLLLPALLVAALLGIAPAPASAQMPSPAKQLLQGAKAQPGDQPEGSPAPVNTREKLAAAQAELAEAQRAPAPTGVPEEEVLERRLLLEQLVALYSRHVEAEAKLVVADRRRSELEARSRDQTGASGQPPYSLLLVEGMRSALHTATAQVQSTEARATLLAQEMEGVRRTLKAAEGQLRQAQERLEGADPERIARLTWSRNLVQLRSRVAGADAARLDAELKLANSELTNHRFQIQLLQQQLAAVSKEVQFSQADLDKVLADLNKQRAAIEQEVDKALTSTATARGQRDEAEGMLAQARETQQTQEESPAARATRIAKLGRLVEIRRVQADNANLGYTVARLNLEMNSQEITGWQYRWLLFGSRESSKLAEAYEAIDRALNRLDSWRQYLESESSVVMAQIGEQERRQRSAASADDNAHHAELAQAYRERAQIYNDTRQLIENQRNTLMLWRQEFVAAREGRSAAAVAQDALATMRRYARAVWDFELFTAEDTVEIEGRKVTAKRSVTVGKSIGVILLLVLGYFVTSWFMRHLQNVLIRRFGVAPNLASILRRWGQFIALAVLFVFALGLVKIPLTLFAFLGGALAIGFGFGAQNLLKNFMSGIMLLIERPLRVGDIVQVGDVVGTVTYISIRSTTVRSGDGIETLIPNSTFVESNVTNWTYSNRQIRRSIKVAVAYGSPTRRVSDVLQASAARHGQLLKDPAPRVIFEDFGSDALIFTLEYWVEISENVDARVVGSDLRFMIEGALSEAGIGIPSSPRDLHISASTPLRVEVVPAPADAAPSAVFDSERALHSTVK